MSYVGQIPLPQATEARTEVTATASQTLFTGLTYVENYLDVYLNGVKLASSDFTATDGNSVTLASGAAAGDIVAFVSRTQTSELVALPLKDSQGNNVLSESAGTVTLTADEMNVGSNSFVVDSSGNVGIGTSSPTTNLQINKNSTSGSSGGLTVKSADSNESFVSFGVSTSLGRAFISSLQNGSGTALPIDFITGSSSTNVRMRIDSSGNVGVGLGVPQEKLQVLGNIHALGSGSGNGTYGPYIAIGKGNGPKISSTQENADDDIQGLAFFTKSSATGSNPPSETVRINSSGNLLVGYTSSNGSYKLQVNSQIWATSNSIATSDFNYKENVTPLDGALSLVLQLNPVQFDWKEHSIHKFDRNQPTVGFIAQEVQQVLADQLYLNSIVKSNECVLEPEETDEEGNVIKEAVIEEFLGIAEGNMIALLTKAIQEQQSIIESQQSQIDALTARIEALEATP